MLQQRILEPERMDQDGLDQRAHRQALAGLRRVNGISRTARRLWLKIGKIMRQRRLASITVLDLACGGGDVPIRLARMARSRGIDLNIEGRDKSETAISVARAAADTAGIRNASFRVCDVLLADESRAGRMAEFDVVLCTLFLHHLEWSVARQFLQRTQQLARHAVLIDDLQRSSAGYWLAQLGCRVLSRSPIVHCDGPASVRAAFTVAEVVELANDAGLAGARLSTHWPQRFLLEWIRT
jgi:2-polyprenyl-3-methyl-5-hydroxy-6-metoxy-1,4-benzoquinol methylase